MARVIKRVIVSCLISVALEFLIVKLYSYVYSLSGGAPLSFSLSRVIAMLIIYWGTSGLMKLQKSPDYGIPSEEAR